MNQPTIVLLTADSNEGSLRALFDDSIMMTDAEQLELNFWRDHAIIYRMGKLPIHFIETIFVCFSLSVQGPTITSTTSQSHHRSPRHSDLSLLLFCLSVFVIALL